MDVNPFVLIGIFFAPLTIGGIIGRIVNVDPPKVLAYLVGALVAGGQILAVFTIHASESWGLWIPGGMVLSGNLFVGYLFGCEGRRNDEMDEKLAAQQPPRSYIEPQIMDATGFPTQRPRD